MANQNIKNNFRSAAQRSFLARDFETLRAQMIEHARIFFPDQVQDFSEASFSGLLVDLAATVGDNLSHYLDHEFRELDPNLAIELDNILMHLKNAGVEPYGASPSTTRVTFTIEVPAESTATGYIPKRSAIPVILQGTVVKSFDGVTFVTHEDLDLAKLDASGNMVSNYQVLESSDLGVPLVFEVSAEVDVSSGQEATENIIIQDTHVPFREINLIKEDVTTVVDIFDSAGNEYYEVAALSQDNVYKAVENSNISDSLEVPSNLEIISAPRRFTKTFKPTTRITTIRFGAGNASTLDDDIIPDPSDLSLDLYGKKYISRFAIDPNNLLKTQTLGISPSNTTLTIRYRYGGGIGHNVGANSIEEIDTLNLEFRNSPVGTEALGVRQSITATNKRPAVGGTNAPTIEDLRTLITSARTAQSRVVTREDLLARIFTMPATFGRVYRASIEPNPNNSLASILYIITKNRAGSLVVAPDTLKKNLSKYLNEFRLISDAMDILDAQVINFGIQYDVVVAQNVNKVQIIQNINNKIASAMDSRYFQINQPIIIDDITNLIINTDYVIALSDLRVFPRTGTIEDRVYSQSSFSFEQSTKNGIIFGPQGGIFEMLHPSFDIIGSAM